VTTASPSRTKRNPALTVGVFCLAAAVVSACRFDQLDIVLEQLVDELVDLHALGLGAGGQVVADLGVKVDRQLERGRKTEKKVPGSFSLSLRQLFAKPRPHRRGFLF